MKRAGYLMDAIASLDNLYAAFRKASRGKQMKAEVRRFAEGLDANVARMRRGLLDGTVAVGGYRHFTIHDPKERVICAAPFADRVLQHAVMNVCHPYFDRTLIATTYATRRGMGVYAAVDRAVEALSRHRHTVKLDVRRYYDSIRHDVLRARLRRLFKDGALLALFDRIIDSYHTAEGRGLPIGNLTSQYFANLYLSDLDHRAKEQWHVPAYIRYMDDILMAADDRALLRRAADAMAAQAEEQLGLRFKPPVCRTAKDGQTFLGYRILPHHYRLAGRSKRRFRTKLLRYEGLLASGQWDERQYACHILPLLAFACHAESKGFRQACLQGLG